MLQHFINSRVFFADLMVVFILLILFLSFHEYNSMLEQILYHCDRTNEIGRRERRLFENFDRIITLIGPQKNV